MISGTDKKQLSSKPNVKMRFFSGVPIQDMPEYLKPLLEKVLITIILHLDTNKCVNESYNKILNKIISLKQCSKKRLPENKIIILSMIERLDNGKAALSVKRLNKDLCPLKVDIIGNSNIGKESLGKKGLDLHPRGSGMLAINFIKKI